MAEHPVRRGFSAPPPLPLDLHCEPPGRVNARLIVTASAAKQSILAFFVARWIASLRSQ